MSELNTINGARLIIPFAANPPLATNPASTTNSSSATRAGSDQASSKAEPLLGGHPAPTGDQFELSAAGAALAALQDAGGSSPAQEGIRVEKVARVRSEVQNGIYDTRGKLEAVLDRILEALG